MRNRYAHVTNYVNDWRENSSLEFQEWIMQCLRNVTDRRNGATVVLFTLFTMFGTGKS